MRKQIRKLILGNGLAQLLQFGAVLILSRIYQPSDFGLLAQVQSVAMIGSIILTLQLHLTIPLAKTQAQALEVVKLIQTLSLIIFIVTLVPAIFIGDVALYAVVLSLFLGLANTYTGYLVHLGNFGRLSNFYLARALLIIAVQIAFAYFGLESGLVIATMIGEALSAIYLGYCSTCDTDKIKIRLRDLKCYVLKNRQFSLYGTIQELISVSAFYAPIFLFVEGFGEDIGGQYAMASRLVWAPVILVSGSYSQVLFHKFGQVAPIDNKEIIRMMPNLWVVLIATVLCATAYIFNDITLALIGGKWELASQMIPLQGIWGIIFFMSTPYRVLIRIFGMQKYQLLIDFGMVGAFVLMFLISGLKPVLLLCAMILIVGLQHVLLVKSVIYKLHNLPLGFR